MSGGRSCARGGDEASKPNYPGCKRREGDGQTSPGVLPTHLLITNDVCLHSLFTQSVGFEVGDLEAHQHESRDCEKGFQSSEKFPSLRGNIQTQILEA